MCSALLAQTAEWVEPGLVGPFMSHAREVVEERETGSWKQTSVPRVADQL